MKVILALREFERGWIDTEKKILIQDSLGYRQD